MPEEPQIGGLSRTNRVRFFWILVVIFLVALPALIFYTTGQRLSFDNDETSIVTTGGVYISTDNLEVDVFMDEDQIERPRLFRNAYYIRDIQAGQHRLVVQRPDLHTWVKELPVDPYIVTEASAFNMPVVPHVRPISEYVTATGTQVLKRDDTVDAFLKKATTTVPFRLATTTSTSTFELNQEFVFVESLFSTTSTSSQSVFARFLDGVERFRFATTTDFETVATTTEEEFIGDGNMRLIDRDGELYAQWAGTIDNIPYYFCISDRSSSTIGIRYGEHVALEVERLTISTTTPIVVDDNRVCRPEIKLDRLQQDVFYYDFFPGSTDLVLLHLEDGIYVTEIDDRAWQNVQQLYPGDDLVVVVGNNSIFVQENGRYFEIITEIEPN
tara:strand:- start:3756 stop:4910 length:1155 start_codon:yes stop_codon:yes gene_type:complete